MRHEGKTHAVYPAYGSVTVDGRDIQVGDLLVHGGIVTSVERHTGAYANPADAPMKVETFSCLPDDNNLPVPKDKSDRPNYIPPGLKLLVYRNLSLAPGTSKVVGNGWHAAALTRWRKWTRNTVRFPSASKPTLQPTLCYEWAPSAGPFAPARVTPSKLSSIR